jgi:hypothetical protein
VLKRLFLTTAPKPVTDLVRPAPTGIWFSYAWLTGETQPLPDATKGNDVAVREAAQVDTTSESSRTQKISSPSYDTTCSTGQVT